MKNEKKQKKKQRKSKAKISTYFSVLVDGYT